MPDYNFPGGVNPRETGSYVVDDREVQTNYFNMPKGPVMADGYRGGLITHVRGWFTPYSGTRGIRIGISNTYTPFYSRAASSKAKDTGWLSLNAIKAPGTHSIRFDVNGGGIRFGRSTGVGTTTGVGFSYTWKGALAGQARVIWSAGAPTALKASVDDQSRVKLTWKPPTNDGGSPVTRYWVQSSTKPNFQSGTITQIQTSTPSATMSGLAPGKSYYFRVYAGNLFNIRRGYGSLPSTSVTAFLPIVPPTENPKPPIELPEVVIPANQTSVPPSVSQFTVRGDFLNLLGSATEASLPNPQGRPVLGRVVFVPDVRSPITAYPEEITFVPTEIHAWINSSGTLVAPSDAFLEEPVKPEDFEARVNLIAPSQLSLSVRNWSWTVHVVPTPGQEWEAFSLRIPGDTQPGATIFLNEEYINTHTTDLTRRRDPGVRSSRLYEVDYLTPPYPFGFDKNLDFLVLNEDLTMWKVYD